VTLNQMPLRYSRTPRRRDLALPLQSRPWHKIVFLLPGLVYLISELRTVESVKLRGSHAPLRSRMPILPALYNALEVQQVAFSTRQNVQSRGCWRVNDSP
jgi:hypothetical protein